MNNTLKVLGIVLLALIISFFASIDSYGVDYTVLLPDRVELTGEHNWNNFNDYQFHQIGIRFVYQIKEPTKNKLIIDNVDNLHIHKEETKGDINKIKQGNK